MSDGRTRVFIVLMLAVVAMTPPVMAISTEELSIRAVHDPINIVGDDGFTEENGVSAGNGTADNPYIIEGWEIDPGYILVWNTNASFVIRDVAVTTNYGVSAISITNASHFTIADCEIDGGGNGLVVSSARDFVIENNTIECGAGAMLGSDVMLWVGDGEDFEVTDNLLTNSGLFSAGQCSDFVFSENEVTASCLTLTECTNASVTTNELAKGIDLQGTALESFDSHEISGNTAGGYQILYFLDEELRTVSNVRLGQLITVNCSEVVVERLYVNNASGVCVYFADRASMTNCTILQPTTGVVAQYCENISVDKCLMSKALVGVHAEEVETLTVSHSILEECDQCFNLDVEHLAVSFNHICDSEVMIGVDSAPSAEIYSNNIVNVTAPLVSYNPSILLDDVVWNKEYPTGGNYWDVYNGTDEYSGPDQNVTGSDGFGDTPYEADLVVDQYPLMRALTMDFGPAIEEEDDVEETDDDPTLVMTIATLVVIAFAVIIALYYTRRNKGTGPGPQP